VAHVPVTLPCGLPPTLHAAIFRHPRFNFAML
jgi:hypothetical protein